MQHQHSGLILNNNNVSQSTGVWSRAVGRSENPEGKGWGVSSNPRFFEEEGFFSIPAKIWWGDCPSNPYPVPGSDGPESLLRTRHSWWATGWNWAWGSSWRQIMDWLVSMATCCLHKRQPVSRYARKFQHIYTRKNSCMKSFMKLQKKGKYFCTHDD